MINYDCLVFFFFAWFLIDFNWMYFEMPLKAMFGVTRRVFQCNESYPVERLNRIELRQNVKPCLWFASVFFFFFWGENEWK